MEVPTRLINLLNIVNWNAKKIFGLWMGQERSKKAKHAFLIESSLAISLRRPPVTREVVVFANHRFGPGPWPRNPARSFSTSPGYEQLD